MTQTFNLSYQQWKRIIKAQYKKDCGKQHLTIKRKWKTFRCKVNGYSEIIGQMKPLGKIKGITAIGSGDGSKQSGTAILYGFILMVNSVFPDYSDKDVNYILTQLKLLGKKRIQSNSRLTVGGVTFRVMQNEAGIMLSCTPKADTGGKQNQNIGAVKGYRNKRK